MDVMRAYTRADMRGGPHVREQQRLRGLSVVKQAVLERYIKAHGRAHCTNL
jgi:hypothetical protein